MTIDDMLHKPSFNYLKKERFTGSFNGKRYILYKEVRDEELTFLVCCIYPEPFCFEKTKEELKKYKDFDFSKDGMEEALKWIIEEEV